MLDWEDQYSYNGNIKHIRTFYKDNGEDELRYSTYRFSNQINDSFFVEKKYNIDSLGFKTIRDSIISKEIKNKSELTKYYLFSEGKLIREKIDSNYYKSDSNHYFYSKSVNYLPRHGYISFSIYDSLSRNKYNRWRSWDNDSAKITNYEKFGYYTDNSNISVKFNLKQTEEGEKRIRESIDIEFKPDQFNLYTTNLYWNEENECYRTLGITLRKLNMKGDIVEKIEIR